MSCTILFHLTSACLLSAGLGSPADNWPSWQRHVQVAYWKKSKTEKLSLRRHSTASSEFIKLWGSHYRLQQTPHQRQPLGSYKIVTLKNVSSFNIPRQRLQNRDTITWLWPSRGQRYHLSQYLRILREICFLIITVSFDKLWLMPCVPGCKRPVSRFDVVEYLTPLNDVSPTARFTNSSLVIMALIWYDNS